MVMLHNGPNEVDGIPVEVIRKRIRRINIRVAADGTVCLSVPKWCYPPRRSRAAEGSGYSGATLRQGEVCCLSLTLSSWRPGSIQTAR